MAAAGKGGRVILWFRNDLRLHDNAIVAEAQKRVQAGTASEVGSALLGAGRHCTLCGVDVLGRTLGWL